MKRRWGPLWLWIAYLRQGQLRLWIAYLRSWERADGVAYCKDCGNETGSGHHDGCETAELERELAPRPERHVLRSEAQPRPPKGGTR